MAGVGGTVKGGRRRTKDNDGTTKLPSLLYVATVVVVAMLILNGGLEVKAAPIATTNETMVVAKTLLVGPCIDDTGAEVGDQAEWTTGCNKEVCHVEPSGNYTVTHGCRILVPSENPDTVNCVTVENTGSAYPDCCPQLQCGAPSYSTSAPSSCFDISDNRTCYIWKELSGNCADTTSFVYNFTLVYCQQTCGYCSIGTG
ncbi:uncharacterized protein [Littorina saxatilis]|uniref:Uncharacterized protein n=1 Tax=Littorina saxatilis TaxID=31220 RepID=A0AAN9G9D2_9CAEN